MMSLLGSLIIHHPCIGQVPPLATTSSFAVFTSAGAINNTGPTTIKGDIGTGVGAFNGFPPGIVLGGVHNEDAVAALAATQLLEIYSLFGAITCDSVIGTILGAGQTLTPNVYCLGAASSLNGNLTLDAQGDPNAIFIFKINGAFSTVVMTNIILANSASICNIYWIVNGQFTLGDNSVFYGTVINDGAIIILNNAYMEGRLLSVAGAVYLNSNIIDNVCSVALPIDLVSFSADCKNQKAHLSWTTAKEVNNDFFTIERSNDAKLWEEIGKVDGSGNSSSILNYSFIDDKPSLNSSFYRIKQVDFDGKFNHSNTINLKDCKNKISDIEVFPNPTNGTLNISYNDATDKFISISIYNSLGELIYYSTNQESTIDLIGEKNGIYILHINMASGLTVTKML